MKLALRLIFAALFCFLVWGMGKFAEVLPPHSRDPFFMLMGI